MDRSKWEVDNKTFGEVFNLFMGRTPSRDNDSYWQDGKYEWLSIGDMGDTKYLSKTKEMISEEAVANMQQVPENTVVMSFKLSIGKVGITSIPLYTNEAIMAFPPKEGYQIMPTFLYYYLQAYKWQPANRAVMGKTLNKAVISSARISIPSVADQQRIVAELDCLNEMIAVKQEQLKEFDKLAQSIFYDMFGDPIKNERGWETDVIGNVVSEKSYRGSIANIEGKVWLLNLDMVESNTGRVIEKLMVPNDKTDGSVTTFNEDYVLYSKLRPYLNKVVMPDSSGYCTTELVTLLPNKTILNRYYLTSLLRSDSFVDYICGKVAGAKMPRVSMKDFRILYIPLPPLSLQQQFAEKISAIEAQKELVKQSIAETQHLLDYTMDKYFNE